MTLLNLIRRKSSSDIATAIHAILAIDKPDRTGSVARIATISVANSKKEKTKAVTRVVESRWWRVHFTDRKPIEICCNPIATVEQVLNANTDAVSAEPIGARSNGVPDPDQYGHWSEAEVELALVRTTAFVSRGLPYTDADILACQLVERDRKLDDRRSCAECLYFARGRCQRSLQPFGGGGVEVLHRCYEFKEPR